MADQGKIKDRAKNIFLAASVLPIESFGSAAVDPLASPQRTFSPFDPNDQVRQADLLLAVFKAFQDPDDANDGLEAALDVLEDTARRGDLELAQHTLGVFSAHAPKVRPGTTSIPVPPLVFAASSDAPSVADNEQLRGSIAETGEELMHWFREDIHLNEHHRHWHMVYAASGIPTGTGGTAGYPFPIRMKSRQGEIFVYMHKQMLARYDTERIANGLEPVTAFSDFSQSLGAGYDPNAREPRSLGYVARADDATISHEDQIDLEKRRESFRRFLQTGKISDIEIPINAATIGTALESNRALTSTTFETDLEYRRAGNMVRTMHLHNAGHGAIARAGVEGLGVMTNPHTSLKDPVFWRWHKMIDDLAEQYYSGLEPYDFQEEVISLATTQHGKSPIAIFSETEFPNLDFDQDDAEATKSQVQLAAQSAFESASNGTTKLKTGTRRERYKYLGRFHGEGVPDLDFERETMFSERFATALRVESSEQTAATVRIFICAEEFLDIDASLPENIRQQKRLQEHRRWIEIDRQPIELTSGLQIVVLLSDRSSIVRKLGGRAIWPTSAITESDFDALHDDAPGDRDDYCDCGWPINLLLPKGRPGGMAFQMMAMVSAGAPEIGPGSCGSRSFCGTDFEGYPELDDLNLGFPFDRASVGGTLQLIDRSKNMAMRTVIIDHVEDLSALYSTP
ncbi:MAG: tyrosinase family protein [Pseudomonadota bacterium]